MDKHLWKHRIIVIFTDSFLNTTFQKQKLELQAYPQDIKDRKLVMYVVTPKSYQFGLQRTSLLSTDIEFLSTFNSDQSPFKIVLIGLDGNVKLSCKDDLQASDIFNRIDQMPMRKNELKN
ncbi:DUF4174 domain-containing protein [Aquimarina sp. U1-2]|uniref:DUF4174 domain-containing protein n=1 Tax=Aquimarina sp. U1-2 TaxID=2823141 RepID=UPI001AEC75C3|nr:DUF4174 domain-containing protein [Aquimarina sp. U1-2]MBP2832942.1 DUF4174 domain-containing protein [Aquimarina sp. U1-2]